MKSVQLQEAIRKAKFKQGKSNRQIAVELNISRNTVKKVVSRKQVTVPVYQRTQPIQYPVMGPYLGLIEDWLREDEAFPRKQRGIRESGFTTGWWQSINFLAHTVGCWKWSPNSARSLGKCFCL